jgi:hypothetical protein
MRPVSFLLTLTIFAVPARAEPLQIHGTTGYAGEYELSGNVSEQDLNGKKKFSGPLIVRHRTRQIVVPHYCDTRLRRKQMCLQGRSFRVVSRLHELWP